MIDLWKVQKDFYYNPFTKGSNSIKAVLPASLHSSDFLKQKYSKPISKINLTSKNFDSGHIWLELEKGGVKSPYKMLPSLFEGWAEDDIENTLSAVSYTHLTLPTICSV